MTPHTRSSSSAPAILTRGLTRHFTAHRKTVEAVSGLDLEIAPGELVAFLGPNGAGKSTTLRMLTTLLAPTSGTASVAGHDVVSAQHHVRRSLGYVGQGNGAGHQQLGRDELVSQGRAYGLTRARSRERADELITALDLEAAAGQKVATLSGGQRRRLDIAMGLVHLPQVLFLDEPSTGLDPQNRANLQDLVRRLHAETGSTIVLTTHYLEEADALAQRVLVIDHGRLIADDTAAALKAGLGDRLTLSFADPDSARAAATRADRLGDDTRVEVTGSTLTLRAVRGHEQAPGLLVDLHASGCPAAGLEVARPTLDDVFLHLTGRSLRESHDGAEARGTASEGEVAA
ncbi:ATP-binding cassette domain-containing protein [Nocardioides campestrisoli]|uniref:ATP-binding cassette domain-containing protein n=1 Tax=Nocardioides campestrisoli TaxID=2736757 RepID=UPI0015E7B818|nr:ATP-binding cassette domain-containing protein [Nocardioides campestrisoli]